MRAWTRSTDPRTRGRSPNRSGPLMPTPASGERNTECYGVVTCQSAEQPQSHQKCQWRLAGRKEARGPAVGDGVAEKEGEQNLALARERGASCTTGGRPPGGSVGSAERHWRRAP